MGCIDYSPLIHFNPFGAFVTRYIGYEGVMPIREGESTNKFLSEKTYLTVLVDGEHEGQALRKHLQKKCCSQNM